MKQSALLIFLLATPLMAQDVDGDDFVQFLVPINAPEPTLGAFGTRWVSEFWIHNGSQSDVNFAWCWDLPVCYSGRHAPGTTERAFAEEVPSSLPALMFDLHVDIASEVTFSSRLFELSRLAQPVGVELPVIREDEFFRDSSRFIAVPRSDQVRSALRVYDPRHRVGAAVRVEVVAREGESLGQIVLPLHYVETPQQPGMALVPDLAAVFPELGQVDRYDVVVSPLEEGFDYWAFVSVTDNDTQQVFTITYQ